MGNDNILTVVVLAIIAYLILTAKEAGKSALGASLFGATAVTPAGTITSTGAAGAVTEIAKGSCLEYIFNPVIFAACIAGKTTTLTQSPQTPAPTMQPQAGRPPAAAIPELCPYDPSLLIGDRRCQMPTGTFTTGYGVFEGGLFTPEQYFK